MVSGIYSIINKKNGKIYIGQSKNIPYRFTKHKSHLKGNYHTNEHLQRAWNKYGADAFEFQIEKVCKLRYLDRFEKVLIKSYRSDDPSNGYNLESGGNKFKSLSQSTKEKLRNINLGKTLSEDTKKKISASLKGRESPMKGRKHSLKSRKKMSESKKGNTNCKGLTRNISSNIKTSKSMNTTGYFRVLKKMSPRYKQGFTWQYQYYENNSRKSLCSVDLNDLKERVINAGLEWRELGG